MCGGKEKFGILYIICKSRRGVSSRRAANNNILSPVQNNILYIMPKSERNAKIYYI